MGPDGHVYVADAGTDRLHVYDPSAGTFDVVAGTGLGGTPGDGGAALSATLSDPSSLAVHDGVLYVAETRTRRVRAVDLTRGTIRAFAGEAADPDEPEDEIDGAFEGDGGPAAGARFDRPSAITVGSDGVVYVADTGNERVRAIGDVELPPASRRPKATVVAGGAGVVLGFGALAAWWIRRRRSTARAPR